MLHNDKCILVYRLTDEELEELKMANLDVIVLTDDMADMKIEDIIGGLRILNYNNRMPEEKLILFNNFDEKLLMKSIKAVRDVVTGGILATVTPTSIKWTLEHLLEHLVEEREWIAMKQKGR
jgi:hypothetical protein